MDVAHAVHGDICSHTLGVISFVHRVISSKSSKQNINTKSSTEAELVGASDFIPNTLWVKWFLEKQGYSIQTNIFYQDNQRAILLEKNGKQ